MLVVELGNRYRWSKVSEIDDWIAGARLDNIAGQLRSLTESDPGVVGHLQRYIEHVGAAARNAAKLLEAG